MRLCNKHSHANDRERKNRDIEQEAKKTGGWMNYREKKREGTKRRRYTVGKDLKMKLSCLVCFAVWLNLKWKPGFMAC